MIGPSLPGDRWTNGWKVEVDVVRPHTQGQVAPTSANFAHQVRPRDAELLQAVIGQAGVGVGLSDVAGRVLAANTALAEMLGYETAEEFIEAAAVTGVAGMTHPDDPPAVWDIYNRLIRGEIDRARVEKPHRRRDGRTAWNSINASLVRDVDGNPACVLALFEDITERRRLEELMRHQRLHDSLTGLPNRVQFFEQLNRVLGSSGARVGVCYLDLDGFKAINETFGYAVGDQLLVDVARRVAACLRRPTQLAARMGGDEFAILVPELNGVDDLPALAQAILTAIALPLDIGPCSLTLSASLGATEDAADLTSDLDLMRGAEAALASAKKAGRNRWAIYDRSNANSDYILLSTMIGAVERGEFFVTYQPIVRMADNRVLGAEALVRWAHPDFGTLLPGRFIDLAENNGLIRSLTRYVLKEACQQAATWHEESSRQRPFVSVNVAADDFRDPGFVSFVKEVLASTGLPAHALQLELTETAYFDILETLALREISSLGIGIAIDDFGTGFSTLAYLRKFSVNTVKLAGEFIENLAAAEQRSRQADEQIVAAVINLAHSLGLKVIAERVSTARQATLLGALGCDGAQGWLYSKPLPPKEIHAMFPQSSDALRFRSG